MKTTVSIILSMFVVGFVLGQQDWNKVDFAGEYKRKVKIGGASSKSLRKNKTIISNYTVSQATMMKGSEKTAKKAIYSEVSLGGLKNEDYQKMVNELYQSFIEQLSKAGLTVTNGKDVLTSDYAMKRKEKDKNKEFIG